MANEIGYVSSYDPERGQGYIRPVDAPKELVQFRDSALQGKDVVRIAAGQEVTFVRDEDQSKSAGRPVAGSVKINEEPALSPDKSIPKQVNKL
jgi:cold shock CspA family protein